MATSGIDHVVRLWTPFPEVCWLVLFECVSSKRGLIQMAMFPISGLSVLRTLNYQKWLYYGCPAIFYVSKVTRRTDEILKKVERRQNMFKILCGIERFTWSTGSSLF